MGRYQKFFGSTNAEKLELKHAILSSRLLGSINLEMHNQAISKSQLAEKLGTGRSNISQLLSGGRNLTLMSLLKLSDALGMELKISLENKKRNSNSTWHAIQLATPGHLQNVVVKGASNKAHNDHLFKPVSESSYEVYEA